ncbi:hypothetical protein [Hydrogenophaga sp.]|uniref:hypothetical protein n=1 Tax=Hydrogenophaga sp. TaxID=1904254 RepID=UPI0035B34994
MSYFDPQKNRETLITFTLGYEEGKNNRPHGSFAKGSAGASSFSTLVKAILVGLTDRTLDIAERTQRWLQEAIDEGEYTTDRDPSSADWHQQSLSYALALTKFLRGQGIDRDSFSRSASLIERAWRTRVPQFERKMIADHQIEYYMPIAFSGGLYADAIRNFEEYHPGVVPNIRTIRSQRGVAYLLCQHKLLGMHDPEQLRKAVNRVLDVNLQSQWLGSGLYHYALHWLMIAYAEDNPQADPKTVVLKAYDHMPKVQRPEWV